MPVKSRTPPVALPIYVVPSEDPLSNRRVFPFETVPIGDGELSSLDHTFARFILPRLIQFREKKARLYGTDPDEDNRNYLRSIDQMIAAFQIMASDDYWNLAYDVETKRNIENGLAMFADFYRALWL